MLPIILRLGVCAVVDTAARVDAAHFVAVGVGVMLPILLWLTMVQSFMLLLGWMLPFLNAVGMDVTLRL